MDAKKLLNCYVAGETVFFDVDLSGADLSGANLSGVGLIRSNLSGADLSKADLSKACLCETDLSGTNLSHSDLNKADLSFTELNRANLRRANLSRANLSGADLSEADLCGANLNRANLSAADLIRADLRRANTSEANLHGADLSEADLRGANFWEAVLINTLLSEAKLDGTILGYQKISEELQRENQELREKLSLLETQFEKCVEKESQRKLIANQGIKANKLTWQGLRFRSEPEKKIAQVLDEMGILFFPLPSGRVMAKEGMVTREVDFLICSQGIWGILECDGELWHPSAAKDHERDNEFKRHGLWFIQRFTDKECKKNPHKVVRQFLDMLHKFHEAQRYLIIGNSTKTESSLLLSNPCLQSKDSSVQSNFNSPTLTPKLLDDLNDDLCF